MNYSSLIKLINSQLDTLLTEFIETTSYDFFKLDEQLKIWLRLALGVTEESQSHSELNYMPSLLMFSTCAAVGGNPQKFIRVAAAIQFMHKASAILDDIQDGDNTHSLGYYIGEREALDLALILITHGQVTLFQELDSLGQERQANYFCLATRLCQNIATGLRGQLLDLQEKTVPLEQRLNQPEAYVKKIALKTALTSSYLAELGAILGGAPAQITEIYRRFGFAFGVALHLLDDLQDFTLGRQVPQNSHDLKNGYLSLAFIYAYLELSKSEDNFLEMITAWGKGEKQHLLHYLFQSKTAFLQTLSQVLVYITQAEQELKVIDRTLEKAELKELLQKLKDLAQKLYYLWQG